MKKLTERHFKAIAAAIKQRQKILLLNYKNSTWRDIHTVTEIGEVCANGKKLQLTKSDLKEVQNTIVDLYKVNVLDFDFDTDRVAVSASGADDKRAKSKPNQDYVLFKVLNDASIAEISSPLTSIRATANDVNRFINDNNIHNALVVENLDIFDRINEFDLPMNADKIIVFYRGDAQIAPSGLKQLLLSLTEKVQCTIFTDYDPAGIQICLTTPKIHSIILPQFDSTKFNIRLSQAEDYDKQSKQKAYVDKQCPIALSQDWDFIKKNRLSLKQQAMLSNKLPLVRIELLSSDNKD
ncbi:hypothetical protein SOPP22_17760 [Shewanella sp. OPT22]|nr:hypothetical protein SOPP22_17760 [Shewanella sp. OPT22]